MKLVVRLPLLFVAFVVLTALVTSYIAGRQASQALHDKAEAMLFALETSRSKAIENYLKVIRQDLMLISANEMTQSAMTKFDAAQQALGADVKGVLQKAYITGNNNETGKKHLLDRASGDEAYHDVHETYHPWFRTLLEERGYYDIFLINKDGTVIYSVFKELDYATNLINGQYQDTDLAAAYNNTRGIKAKGFVSFHDFKPYAPSNDAPASFIASPILDAAGRYIGSLVFQMPIGRINEIMNDETGMGETGETYLVGEDFLMRSDSRFSDDSTILKTRVDTETVRKAFAGETGVQIAHDYRGVEVTSAYGAIAFHGVKYAVIAEIDEAEVQGPIKALQRNLIVAGVIVTLAFGFAGFLVARHLARRVANMTDVMSELASDRLDINIPDQDRVDEFGEMARAVNVFKENGLKVRALADEQKRTEQRAAEEQRKARNAMADDFESSVGDVLQAVTSTVAELRDASSTLTESSRATTQRSAAVAAASEQATVNTKAVASSAEQLSGSITEIATQVDSSSRIARDAVEEASSVQDRVSSLLETSQHIGEVVDMISDIAGQTNMLALNATIEAERAGAAGKGFAVVATEVKSLAAQTGEATREISDQVVAIQAATTDAAKAIQGIASTISRMNDISSSISAAVEEQGAATQEIAGNVKQVADGTAEVTENVTHVSRTAEESGSRAEALNDAASELSNRTDMLSGKVQQFLQNVRQ